MINITTLTQLVAITSCYQTSWNRTANKSIVFNLITTALMAFFVTN